MMCRRNSAVSPAENAKMRRFFAELFSKNPPICDIITEWREFAIRIRKAGERRRFQSTEREARLNGKLDPESNQIIGSAH